MVNYFSDPATSEFNPLDSPYFATGGNDKCVKVWKVVETEAQTGVEGEAEEASQVQLKLMHTIPLEE